MPDRFYLSPEDIQGDRAVLRGKEAHHAVKVMRTKVGECLTLFDGKGREYRGMIRDILKNEVVLSLLGEYRTKSQAALSVTVACALPKRMKMESVIEKLTELGAASIVPLSTERSVPKVEKGEESKKILRFKRIAAEAAKQCGALSLPEIPGIFSFSELLRTAEAYDLALFLDPEGTPIRTVLKEKVAKKVIVAVGPEGGWSEAELKSAREGGWTVVSLGRTVLKVDTACISAVSVLQYALNDSI